MQNFPLSVSSTGVSSPTALGVLSPLQRGWQALVRLHRGIEATMWGRLLLANAWPAYLFALLLIGRLAHFPAKIEAVRFADAADALHTRALLAQEVTTTLFLALVVALFLVRRPVVGRRADWRGGAVALAGTFLLNVVGFLDIEWDVTTTALLASTGVIVGGTLFTIWSLAVLGRCFGILPEVRGLVQRGPYRWVRHPVYLGEIISAFGIVLARPHPLLIALYVLFVGLQYWRAVLEERALVAAFPNDYPAFRRRTGRLWPRLAAPGRRGR